MDQIIRDVRDIDGDDRQALEHVIGQRLRENQQVIINVVTVDVSSRPTESPRPYDTQSEDEIPQWWKVYEGLSDEEIDRLDKAIRERANLTRVFE